jgi:protein ImuA
VYGSGLLAFGGDPNRMMIVRVPDQREAMRAAEEAVHCAALGAVLVEIWGKSHVVGLTATRRLGFAAARSGLPCILVRLAATPAPSAAMTRWSVSATPSRRLEANAPGPPAFALTLLRHRTGIPGSTLHVEWDRDCLIFTDLAPIPCPMVSLPVSRAIDTVESRLWLRVG